MVHQNKSEREINSLIKYKYTINIDLAKTISYIKKLVFNIKYLKVKNYGRN